MIPNKKTFSYPPGWQQALPLACTSLCLGCTLGALIFTVRRIWLGTRMRPALQMGQGAVGMAVMALGTRWYVRKKVSAAVISRLTTLVVTDPNGIVAQKDNQRELLEQVVKMHREFNSSLTQLKRWPFIQHNLTNLAIITYMPTLLHWTDRCGQLWADDLRILIDNNPTIEDESNPLDTPLFEIHNFVQRAAFKHRKETAGLTYRISKNGHEHYLLGTCHLASQNMLANRGVQQAMKAADKLFVERLDIDFESAKLAAKMQLFETHMDSELIELAQRDSTECIALETQTEQEELIDLIKTESERDPLRSAMEVNSFVAAWILGSEDRHQTLAKELEEATGALTERNQQWLTHHLLKPNALYGEETVTVAVGFLHISGLLTELERDGFTVEQLTE